MVESRNEMGIVRVYSRLTTTVVLQAGVLIVSQMPRVVAIVLVPPVSAVVTYEGSRYSISPYNGLHCCSATTVVPGTAVHAIDVQQSVLTRYVSVAIRYGGKYEIRK